MSITFIISACDQYRLSDRGFVDLASAEKSSCYYNLDSKGNLVSWAPQKEVVFQFDNNFPEQYMDRIRESASVWKNSSGVPVIRLVAERRLSTSSQNDGVNTIYWVNDATKFRSNEQARTVIRWKKSQIVDADILINAASFQYFNDPPSSGFKIHMPSLLVHEFGHALGLRHIPILNSLMYSQLGYLQVRTSAHEIDIASMRCEYL